MNLSSLDETQLVGQCMKGIARAQKELYDRFSPRMFSLCLRYASDADQAQDFLQDGFIKAFNNLGQWSGSGSFEGWLRRVIVNTALSILRKNRPLIAAEDISDMPMALQDNAVDVISTMSADELMAHVQALPDGYRIVFNLYVVEGYNHKEIAEKLGITESTSKTQLLRARAALQKKLKKKRNENLQDRRPVGARAAR